MVLHILEITSEGVAVEWLSHSRKNYWVKKIFAVLPAEQRFYAAKLIFQNLLFGGIKYLEKLHDWDFETSESLIKVSLITQHSRILTKCAKTRWYWQWLRHSFLVKAH